MATNILSFPSSFATLPFRVWPRGSLSAEESLFNHPRFGFPRVERPGDPAPKESEFIHPRFGVPVAERPSDSVPEDKPSLDLPDQIPVAVAHMTGEIAHYTTRLRLLRFITQSVSLAIPPG